MAKSKYTVFMASFREKVYSLARTIPPGKVMTYGQLAALAGSPKAARAVGMCMSQNLDNKTIPCHRVVASNGKLTGFAFGGISAKKRLLEKEGVQFIGDRVNLSEFLWGV
jgi:methylated-DNA-protein-cysteine methyltransferase related protein